MAAPAVVVLLVVAALLGTAWYFSSQLLDVAHGTKQYTVMVFGLHRDSIKLARTADTARPGVFGMQWPGGDAKLGAILAINGTSVTRRLSGRTGGLQGVKEIRIEIRVYSSPGDDGLRYTTVRVPDKLGAMPAWYVPGRRRTWVVLVHGRGADRTDGIRPMPSLARMGFPLLDISYRNDVGAPASPDHLYHLGATEWQDVEAAVRYATLRGARGIVLYGYSMGGNIVEDFLRNSREARLARAVVLDAPVLDWNSPLGLAGRQRHLPGFVIALAEKMVAIRLGLFTLDELNATRSASTLRAPTLIFHGTQDGTVPIGPSETLARAHPDRVTLVRVPGADHTEAWNLNPASYDAHLRAFLTHVLG